MPFYSCDKLKNLKIENYDALLATDGYYDYIPTDDEMEENHFHYDDASIFIFGSCHLFALALQMTYGYKIYQLEVSGGVHYFCKSKDGTKFIDVRGVTGNFKEFTRDTTIKNAHSDNSIPYEIEVDDLLEHNADLGLAFALAIIKTDFKRYQV